MIKHETLCKTLIKQLTKGNRRFYRFLLIIDNLDNTYVENLKMSNFICFLSKLTNCFEFFKKHLICKP
jgi:hypothetical protein